MIIDIAEKTFKEKKDDGLGYKEPKCMKEFLLAEKPFENSLHSVTNQSRSNIQ